MIFVEKLQEDYMNEKLDLNIRKVYASLRKSEKKTADYILNYKGSFTELTLEKIANDADVSQPTVLRFIKALGYSGFKEFRYVLAKEDERDENDGFLYGFKFTENDDVSIVPEKVISTSIEQLKNTLLSISQESLKSAVDTIINAESVVVYYVENSSCVAEDLITKLMYLGINCCSYSDYYTQAVSARNLKKGDVAIGISYSGCSKGTVDAVIQAKRAGATVIAITNFSNALIVKYADLVLCTSDRQFMYGSAIFSRVSQMAVIDMIYTGIILSDYKKYTSILDRNSRIIKKQAYENSDI